MLAYLGAAHRQCASGGSARLQAHRWPPQGRGRHYRLRSDRPTPRPGRPPLLREPTSLRSEKSSAGQRTTRGGRSRGIPLETPISKRGPQHGRAQRFRPRLASHLRRLERPRRASRGHADALASPAERLWRHQASPDESRDRGSRIRFLSVGSNRLSGWRKRTPARRNNSPDVGALRGGRCGLAVFLAERTHQSP